MGSWVYVLFYSVFTVAGVCVAWHKGLEYQILSKMQKQRSDEFTQFDVDWAYVGILCGIAQMLLGLFAIVVTVVTFKQIPDWVQAIRGLNIGTLVGLGCVFAWVAVHEGFCIPLSSRRLRRLKLYSGK